MEIWCLLKVALKQVGRVFIALAKAFHYEYLTNCSKQCRKINYTQDSAQMN